MQKVQKEMRGKDSESAPCVQSDFRLTAGGAKPVGIASGAALFAAMQRKAAKPAGAIRGAISGPNRWSTDLHPEAPESGKSLRQNLPFGVPPGSLPGGRCRRRGGDGKSTFFLRSGKSGPAETSTLTPGGGEKQGQNLKTTRAVRRGGLSLPT